MERGWQHVWCPASRSARAQQLESGNQYTYKMLPKLFTELLLVVADHLEQLGDIRARSRLNRGLYQLPDSSRTTERYDFVANGSQPSRTCNMFYTGVVKLQDISQPSFNVELP